MAVFTDPNLHRAAAGGWNLKALAEGKIGTLVGGREREGERREEKTRQNALPASQRPDRQTDRQTGRQTDKQTDRGREGREEIY